MDYIFIMNIALSHSALGTGNTTHKVRIGIHKLNNSQ